MENRVKKAHVDPLISVIIPVFKVEEYLERCIESVLAQTYSNIEIILVDDGSPDRCPGICDLFSEKDSRVITIHKKNGGLSSARNAGLDHVHGEYISFIDSDDYVSPFFLERLYRRINEDKTDMVICEYKEVGNAKTNNKNRKKNISDRVVDRATVMRMETTSNYMFCIIACNKLFKAETWSKLRFIDGKYSEDNFAFTSYIKTINTVSLIAEPLYYYEQRDGSLLHSYNLKKLDSIEARLERACYYLSITQNDLAHNILERTLGGMLAACTRLDMSDPMVKERYTELYERYKEVYRYTKRKRVLSARSLASTLYVKNERLSCFFYKGFDTLKGILNH